MTFKLI